MTWSISAGGHAQSASEEARVIELLRAALADAGATYGTISTQHHGLVSITGDDEQHG